jgi:electron transport complex protein RnfG
MNKKPVLLAGVVLGTFSLFGVGLVAVTHALTDERIAANERLSLLRKLEAIVPPGSADNDIVSDLIEVRSPELLGTEVTQVYRARSEGRPVAVILNPVVPDGYAGPIQLLVSVLSDGTLGGVRVVSHHETPGLGDRIEEQKSDWVLSFNGRSLGDPPEAKWKVQRDGGVFDQFTGATITPRAIVRTVKNTLRFVKEQGEALYRPTLTAESERAERS